MYEKGEGRVKGDTKLISCNTTDTGARKEEIEGRRKS
jgi:hypothetical protein